MVEVFVGIGTNLEPEKNLGLGLGLLRRHCPDLCLSPVYKGPAIGVAGNDFLNAVARFRWSKGFAALTSLVESIHRQAGRTAHERAADGRTLDVDVELFGHAVDPNWRVPRRDVLAYDFVLAPLAQLAPNLPHPLLGSTMQAFWAPRAQTTLVHCLGDYVQFLQHG